MSHLPAYKDHLEQATHEFLTQLDQGVVVYEPRRSGTFPDFKVGRNVLDECTLLAPKAQGKSGDLVNLKGIQTAQSNVINDELQKYQAEPYTNSIFVLADIKRPTVGNDLRRIITVQLDSYEGKPVDHQKLEQARRQVELEFAPSTRRYSSKYSLGAIMPYESSGWWAESIETQIRDAYEKKTTRALQDNESGNEFWLAVGGLNTCGLRSNDLGTIIENIRPGPPWSKLLLIDYLEPQRSKIIYALKTTSKGS